MRDGNDAHRSLARYVSEILGDDYDVWTLRTLTQEGRPYAVVKPVQIPTIRAASKQITDVVQPFVVYIYPDIGATAIEGQQTKLAVEEALYQAFFVDAAERVPLYDYSTGGPGGTAIPFDQPGPPKPSVSAVYADGSPAGYDYMRVREYMLHHAQDSEDERRWSITLTLRLAWRRHGKLISGPPMTSVKVTAGSLNG